MRTVGTRFYVRKFGLPQSSILYFKSRKRRNEFLSSAAGRGYSIVSSNDLSPVQQLYHARRVTKVAA